MADRPNIVFYLTDQQRADLMGCAGHPQVRTPNLDLLAARGARLDGFHVCGTVCMPSRASILTGLYPGRHGVVDNGFNLPEGLPTLPGLLRGAGYHTGVVGRTHVRVSRTHPVLPAKEYYGFEECVHSQCYWEGLDPHGEYLQWIRREHPDRYHEAATPDWPMRDDAHCSSWWTLEDDKTMTAWCTDEALRWVEGHRRERGGQPFFLHMGTWDPHARFIIPPPWDRMYPPEGVPDSIKSEDELEFLPPHWRRAAMTEWKRRPDIPLDQVVRNSLSIYWGTISHIDDQFGRLVRGLDALGLLEETLIVFTSDHGEMAHNHWVWNKGPYFMDDATRVPALLAGPGVRAGTASGALAEEVDWLPTLLDLSGVPVPETVQGRSFRGLLEGSTDRHREEVFHEYQYLIGAQSGHGREEMFGIRTERYRITCYAGRPYGELFDLGEDPNCLHNLWDRPEHAGLRREMERRLLYRMMANQAVADTRIDWW